LNQTIKSGLRQKPFAIQTRREISPACKGKGGLKKAGQSQTSPFKPATTIVANLKRGKKANGGRMIKGWLKKKNTRKALSL